jgi:hypothetical protein
MTAVATDIFERLSAGRPPQPEEASKQPRKNVDLKTLLKDILLNGPVPATLVQERGAAHGFSKKQLWRAKQQMKIISRRETEKRYGRWFWVLPYDMRGIPAPHATLDF